MTSQEMQIGQRVRCTGRGWTHGRMGTVTEVGTSTVMVEVEGTTWTGSTGGTERQTVSVRMHQRHVEAI